MKPLPAMLVAVSLLSGCYSAGVTKEPKWVGFGVAARAEDGPVKTEDYPYFGTAHTEADRAVLVPPILRCRVQSVSDSLDRFGEPAVTVELDERDKPAYEAFTAEHVGEVMAVLVDGKVVMQATVGEKLPGLFSLSGKFSAAEYAALKASLE